MLSCEIVLKFCTYHDSVNVVLYANLQNDWTTFTTDIHVHGSDLTGPQYQQDTIQQREIRPPP